MNSKQPIFIVVCLTLLGRHAHANDILFSAATFPVVAPLFLGWLIVGLFLKAGNANLVTIGPFGIILVVLAVYLTQHPEIVLIVWMIYLGLLVVYFAFPRKNVSAGKRRLNLRFHGAFLLLLIAGGITAKVLFYSKIGGFARWTAQMQENAPLFLPLAAMCAVFVLVRFYWGVVKKKQPYSAGK